MRLYALLALALLTATSTIVRAQDDPMPAFPDVKIMIVVPEFHQGAFGLLDEAARAGVTWTLEGYQAGQPWLEAQLIQRFVDAGYTVTDPSEYAFGRYTTELQPVISDATGALARDLAANSSVDLVIVGVAMLVPNAPDANPATVQVQAVLRAVSGHGDGQIICSSDATGSGTDAVLDTAAHTAAVATADSAAAELMAAIGALTVGPTALVAGTDPGTTPVTPTTPTGPPGIAVMPFDDRSGPATASWDLSNGIPDLLAAELATTATRPVIARGTVSQAVQAQGWQASDLFNGTVPVQDIAAQLNADVAVYGRIVQITTGKVKRLIPLPGGARLGMERATVRLELKIVDLTSGAVLATCQPKGESTEAILGEGSGASEFGSTQFEKSAAGYATQKAISAAAAAVLKALPSTCGACGVNVTAADKFCPGCGAAVSAGPATCPKCKEPEKRGDKFCRKCGEKL
jgi:TolB-like protein